MIRLKESWYILLFLCVVTALLSYLSVYLALMPFFGLLMTIFFFRDPVRKIPEGDNILISPADGRVLNLEEIDDPFVGKAIRLSIFMSLMDVHVNRCPFNGKVVSVKHRRGKKVTAYKEGDLSVREMNRIEMDAGFNFVVEQYAGIFARRIVCYVDKGDSLIKGDKIGMIKFSSRVDVIMPKKIIIKVSRGDRLFAGESILGELDAED